MKTKIRYLVLFIVMAMGSCKKDDELTRETQTGANTFSCLINNQLFTPKASLFSGKALSAGINLDGKSLVIGAFNAAAKSHIQICINNSYKGVGTYLLDLNNSNNKADKTFITYSIADPLTKDYTTELTGQGRITITRADGNILSGTFEFVAQNLADPTDEVTGIAGRFDILGNGY